MKNNKILLALSILSFLLLKYRIHITHSYFYLFLIWNLFLAFVPLGLTTYLSENINKYSVLLIFPIWLLFLPNAPYIVTDLIHLNQYSKMGFWYDFVLISSFASAGLLAYFESIKQMDLILKQYLDTKTVQILFVFIAFLNGFGIYLGRFLRWNSWDIIHKPNALFLAIYSLIRHPIAHLNLWLFTSVIGMFLALGFWWIQTQELKNEK